MPVIVSHWLYHISSKAVFGKKKQVSYIEVTLVYCEKSISNHPKKSPWHSSFSEFSAENQLKPPVSGFPGDGPSGRGSRSDTEQQGATGQRSQQKRAKCGGKNDGMDGSHEAAIEILKVCFVIWPIFPETMTLKGMILADFFPGIWKANPRDGKKDLPALFGALILIVFFWRTKQWEQKSNSQLLTACEFTKNMVTSNTHLFAFWLCPNRKKWHQFTKQWRSHDCIIYQWHLSILPKISSLTVCCVPPKSAVFLFWLFKGGSDPLSGMERVTLGGQPIVAIWHKIGIVIIWSSKGDMNSSISSCYSSILLFKIGSQLYFSRLLALAMVNVPICPDKIRKLMLVVHSVR